MCSSRAAIVGPSRTDLSCHGGGRDAPDPEVFTYTPRILRFYDVAVHGLMFPMVWRCPGRRLLRPYRELLAARHLEIGVGTGYLLRHGRWPTRTPQVVLLDRSAFPLEATRRRIANLRPTTVLADAIEPFPDLGAPFGSVGMSLLLHCLPGPLANKARVFDHVRPWMAPGAVVFGATVLGKTRRTTRRRRLALAYMNRRGIFSNREDDLDGLRQELDRRFPSVRVERIGQVACFEARSWSDTA